MKIADSDILILPGLGSAGPGHWQQRWADRFPNGRIVEQIDWDDPDPEDWIAAIGQAILMATRPVVLVGHSLAVPALVHVASGLVDTKVRGALLVSPPDLESNPDVPDVARRFAPVPRDPLPFPSLLVVSTDDPYCSVEQAADMAGAWGSEFHAAGAAGHINLESGHGPWPEGLMMFTRLMQRI
jgi:predicted alpha/beta hydrolase family esterase